jgi:thiol-disulfide isomerase/thioredoxin
MKTAVLKGHAALIIFGVLAAQARAQEQDKAKEAPAQPQSVSRRIRGVVVDEAGKPVSGAVLSRLWFTSRDQPLKPFEPVKTAADGSFAIDLTFFYGRPYALGTLDIDRKRGGIILVEAASADELVTVKVGPLIQLHGKYECKELGKPVGWTNTILFAMAGRINFSDCQSTSSQFEFWLPPGTYQIQGYGSSDVAKHKREITLDAGKPDVDLGAIDLAASKIAKLKGKAAPTLLSTDARGVRKGAQISDYQGKWVVLEFWGYWCGPCVGRALPQLMEIYDDHEDERDKYVVLTVHSPDTKDFFMLDEKAKSVVRDTWAGRKLPFPILLDGDGKIQETFDVNHWPTTLLFDPEGKLVGEVQPEALEAKLKKVPLETLLPRKLDRQTIFSCDNSTLKDAFAYLKMMTHVDFELDKKVSLPGVSESTTVPLSFTGRVSLRSALELLLDPLDLTAVVGPNGYVITPRPSSDSGNEPGPTKIQETVRASIANKLKDLKTSYDFDKAPLAKVASFFEEQTNENVVLDPRGRLQGKIDPKVTITGAGTKVPLGEALEKLVGPLGLRAVVRDEVIVLEAR